jgi:glycine/D-amino acid oxidase-like deaminating enzyme
VTSSMSGKKKVVVVGGGVAGSKVAKDLEGIVDLTLIDPYVPPLSILNSSRISLGSRPHSIS